MFIRPGLCSLCDEIAFLGVSFHLNILNSTRISLPFVEQSQSLLEAVFRIADHVRADHADRPCWTMVYRGDGNS